MLTTGKRQKTLEVCDIQSVCARFIPSARGARLQRCETRGDFPRRVIWNGPKATPYKAALHCQRIFEREGTTASMTINYVAWGH